MENITGEKEIMAWKKNADGVAAYYYKKVTNKSHIIQKDWFKEHGYKRGEDQYPEAFYEHIEKTLTPGRRAYWALMTDGDGSISLDRRQIRVRIGLTAREPIQYLADLYGTSISLTKSSGYSGEILKDTYKISLTGKRDLHFLYLICPYMVEKRKKATQLINLTDPNYHPLKIPMNFKKYPGLIEIHKGMVVGFFESEGSVGIKSRTVKIKTKTKGTRFYSGLTQWIHFTNSNLRPLRKIKKILESSPFTFKPKIYEDKHRGVKKNGERQKTKYKLYIPNTQHLLFMTLFAPLMLMQDKKDWFEKFHMKKQIYDICKK